MKKLYYIECDSEYSSEHLVEDINAELGYCGWYPTKKQAHEAMVKCKNEAKKCFADRIALQKKQGNTITIDLWLCEVEDNFDVEENTIWSIDNRQLLECRYLCGRY